MPAKKQIIEILEKYKRGEILTSEVAYDLIKKLWRRKNTAQQK